MLWRAYHRGHRAHIATLEAKNASLESRLAAKDEALTAAHEARIADFREVVTKTTEALQGSAELAERIDHLGEVMLQPGELPPVGRRGT